MDISPYAYRWLKAVHLYYYNMTNIAGYNLYEGEISGLAPNTPTNSPIFMFPRSGSQGMAPHPVWWRQFQDWYHVVKLNKTFHPYVSSAKLFTKWYKDFEQQHKEDTMWEMWYIYFMNKHGIFSIFSNIGAHMHSISHSFDTKQYLAYHRRENGLHFKGPSLQSSNKLISKWDKEYINFPETIEQYNSDGKRISP